MHKAMKMTAAEARNHIFPTSDVFSRYLLSSPKNAHLTKSFINAVLEDADEPTVSAVTILSPFNLRESIYDKETVMDVKVSDSEGLTYDIEIQTSTSASFWNRLTYYNNTLFNGQVGESDEYGGMKNATVIALLKNHIYRNGTSVQPSEKLHHFSLVVHGDDHDDPFYPLGDPEKYHILELDRFAPDEKAVYTVHGSEKRTLAPSLFRWLRFFADGGREDFMEQYEETDTAIAEAKAEYEKFLTTEQLRDAQLRHEMWLHDRAQDKADARREGLAEGRAEGKKQGLKEGQVAAHAEDARRMKELGISDEVIEKITGLKLK